MNLKKKLLFLFMLSISCVTYAGDVTVTTENLKVNGVLITNNTINFDSNASINATLDVKLKTFNGASTNTFGNLYLYYKASSTESEVQVGFAAVTFIVTYPPFVTQTTYTSNIPNLTVTLSKSAFFASGGVLYAKYINNNNVSDSSSNILITGGSRTSTTPVPIYSGTNTVCCNQTIRKGDRPALITGSALNLAPGQGVFWSKNGSPYLSYNYATGNQSTSFQSDYLFDSCYFKRCAGGAYSNAANITVVQNPISSNFIYTNAALMENGSYEISVLSSLDLNGLGAQVNLNVLTDPNHVPVRGDSYANSNEISYQWQYTNGFQKWIDVPSGTTGGITNFIPDNYNSDYYFRRIAKYQNISLCSNELRIIFRKTSASNTICCNQLLTASVSAGISLPEIIVGSTPQFSFADGGSPISGGLTITYQWQQQINSSSWVNILNANAKDYQPPAFTNLGTTINYRRVVRFEYFSLPTGSIRNYETYSNTVSVTSPRSRANSKNGIDTNSEISIYPNPTSSIINIYYENDFQDTNIRIFDIVGKEIHLNPVIVDSSSISFDVSNLENGVYFISFENKSKIISKKFIKK